MFLMIHHFLNMSKVGKNENRYFGVQDYCMCILVYFGLFKNYLYTVLLTRLSNLLECIVKRLGR